MEVLKPINGYEGLYSISSKGRVYSHITSKSLKPKVDKDGYLRVTLTRDGKPKSYYVHRLVGYGFVSGYKSNLQINHLDEVKDNNHYINLEWCTNKENMDYSYTKRVVSIIKAKAKHYLITYPCGKEEVVFNLTQFCRDNKLQVQNMCKVSKGKRNHHQNYKCEEYYGDKQEEH